MDKGMKKVVNLVTNYMSALCETGRVPGRVDRNIEAGTAVYFPGGGASEVIESPEDCARVLNEYIRHCLSLFEPTGFYLDDVILGPAKQPTEGKVFGNVIEECLEAFFSACCQDVEYTQSQEYFADFAENNELEFYENGICIRHR